MRVFFEYTVNKLIIHTSFSRKRRAPSLSICVQIPKCQKHFRTGSRKAQRTLVTRTAISSYNAFTAIMSTGKLFLLMMCFLCQLLYYFFFSQNFIFIFIYFIFYFAFVVLYSTRRGIWLCFPRQMRTPTLMGFWSQLLHR